MLPDDVDSSRHVHHARPVCGGAGPAAPTVTVNEGAGWVLGASSSSPPGPGPRHHQGPIRNTMTDLTLNRTGLPLVPFGQEATLQARPAGGRVMGRLLTRGDKACSQGPTSLTQVGAVKYIPGWTPASWPPLHHQAGTPKTSIGHRSEGEGLGAGRRLLNAVTTYSTKK